MPVLNHVALFPPNVEDAEMLFISDWIVFADAGGEHIMFENSIAPVFAYGDPLQEDEILAHDYRLAFDTSHCFIELHGNNQKLTAS